MIRVKFHNFFFKFIKIFSNISLIVYILQQQGSDEDTEDNGSECVICMSEVRDTLILPCRHLCLCNSCADSLRYQANNCPICRAPFRALLQIKALQKSIGTIISNPPLPEVRIFNFLFNYYIYLIFSFCYHYLKYALRSIPFISIFFYSLSTLKIV